MAITRSRWSNWLMNSLFVIIFFTGLWVNKLKDVLICGSITFMNAQVLILWVGVITHIHAHTHTHTRTHTHTPWWDFIHILALRFPVRIQYSHESSRIWSHDSRFSVSVPYFILVILIRTHARRRAHTHTHIIKHTLTHAERVKYLYLISMLLSLEL